jgi:cell division protein FtsB
MGKFRPSQEELLKKSAEIQDVEKQLELKDLFIKQLSRNDESNKSSLDRMAAERNAIQAEISNLKSSVDHWKQEAEQGKFR